MIEFKRNVICDRCEKTFHRNEAYSFCGNRGIEGRITGFRMMGNRTYNLPRMDLCDDCLKSFCEWFGRLPEGASEVEDGPDDE